MPRLTTLGGRVPNVPQRITKRPKVADDELLTPEHRAWRKAVLDRAGWRCEWIEKGVRCSKSAADGSTMYADHVTERADGGALQDLSNGRCLCASHHVRKTNAERKKRNSYR